MSRIFRGLRQPSISPVKIQSLGNARIVLATPYVLDDPDFWAKNSSYTPEDKVFMMLPT